MNLVRNVTPDVLAYYRDCYKKLYLGSPYSCSVNAWELQRFEYANIAAMTLIHFGFTVFSPLSHSHTIALVDPSCKNDHNLWLAQDLEFLKWADILGVLTQPGWRESKGLRFERLEFHKRGKPVLLLSQELIFELDMTERRRRTPCMAYNKSTE